MEKDDGRLSRRSAYIKVWFLCVLPIVMASCGGKSVRPGSESMGPPPPPAVDRGTSQPAGPMGPEAPMGPLPDVEFKPPSDAFVLVLGPGLARTMAYLGVLRELESARVTVTALVGVEMGAVIASIWASSNSNTLDWEMHKFKRETLLDFPMFSLARGNLAAGKAIERFLNEAVKIDLMQRLRVPVFVASSIRGETGVLLENSGSIRDIVRGAISIPGILAPYSYGGKQRLSAAVENPFPAARASGLGLGRVLCVDVLGRGDDFSPNDNAEEHLAGLMKSAVTIARDQLTKCDEVLTVPTAGIGFLDFRAKADLIYRGRMAAKAWLERVR